MSETNGPEYWWCSVGGNSPEPCTLVREHKLPGIGQAVCAYTARCPDPFFVEDKNCPLKLIKEIKSIPRFNVKTFKNISVPSRFHGYFDFGN